MQKAATTVPDNFTNAGIPGVVIDFTHNGSLARILGIAVFIVGVAVLGFWCKRLDITAFFVFLEILTVLSQTISWRMYFEVAVLGVLLIQENKAAANWQRLLALAGAMALDYVRYFVDSADSMSGRTINGVSQSLGCIILLSLLAKHQAQQT